MYIYIYLYIYIYIYYNLRPRLPSFTLHNAYIVYSVYNITYFVYSVYNPSVV